MEFWWRHMPDGMYLRSGLDWHLDPLGERTLEAYARAAGIAPGQLHPIPVGLFRDYGRWYQEAYGLAPDPPPGAPPDPARGRLRGRAGGRRGTHVG